MSLYFHFHPKNVIVLSWNKNIFHYTRYNEDKTQMTPSSQEDVKRLEEYYLNINLVK